MRAGLSPTAGWLLAAGYLMLAPAGAAAATVVIQVEGVRPGSGTVYAAVCATSFEEAECPYRDRQPPAGTAVTMSVEGVQPGNYAIAVFQDTNGNGRLDRLLFFPTEPYGFSNDIGRRSPPSFEAARITVREPTTTVIVRLR